MSSDASIGRDATRHGDARSSHTRHGASRTRRARRILVNAVAIARVELRRSRRRVFGKTSKKIQFAILAITIPLYSLIAAVAAYFAGRIVAAGEVPINAPAWTGAALVGIALFVSFFVVQQVVKTGGIDPLHGLLTTVPYTDVAVGLALATLGRVMALLGVPIVLVAVAFGAGSASPLAMATVTLFLSVGVALGVLLGVAVGFLIPLVAGRSEFLTRHKSAISFALSLLIPAVWIVGATLEGVYGTVGEVLLASPATWAGHAILLPVGGSSADPVLAAGAYVTTPLLLGVGLAATVVLAGRVWYADPVQPEHEHRHGRDRRFDLFAGVPATARAVARKSLRRARRAPFTVQYAIFPFFFLIYQLQAILLEGSVPPGLAVELAVASAMTGGAAFSLNPLGSEEHVLPLTLTASASGWEFVGGLALAGAVIAVPLAVVLPTVAGVAAGLGPVAIGAAILTGLVLTATVPGMAAGLGVIFPKFERSTIGTGREVVVPSTWAFVGYVFLLGPVASPAVLTQVPLTSSWIGGLLGLGATGVAVVGLFATTLLAAAVGTIGYAYAADRVGDYQID